MKNKITSPTEGFFRTHQAYSPEAILAAGGATAFGRKAGKDNTKLIEKLKNAPVVEPFTEEEWHNTLKQLKDSK